MKNGGFEPGRQVEGGTGIINIDVAEVDDAKQKVSAGDNSANLDKSIQTTGLIFWN